MSNTVEQMERIAALRRQANNAELPPEDALKALEDCQLLWDEVREWMLADLPESRFDNINTLKESALERLDMGNPMAGCPCCQYVKEKVGDELNLSACCHGGDDGFTHLCPLVSLWPNGCLAPGSLYRKIAFDSDSPDRPDWASCISQYAGMLAERLRNKISTKANDCPGQPDEEVS